MLNRRNFLGQMAQVCGDDLDGSLGKHPFLIRSNRPRDSSQRMAVITTEWRYHSHAWHMAERFLHGFPMQGLLASFPVQSRLRIRRPASGRDLAPSRSQEYGFPIYGSIAEALRCGGDKLAVDAVLIIGEHGDYPINEFGQKQYTRYEFFKQVTEVYQKDGKTAPVFNDKHLSWNFAKAKEMVDLSKSMNFAFSAGSSLPSTCECLPSISLTMPRSRKSCASPWSD